MTRQNIEIELQVALNALKGSGMIDRPAIEFIKEAVAEKLARRDECLAVPRMNYIRELVSRKDRLDDEDFGRFVKKTLWTVMEKY